MSHNLCVTKITNILQSVLLGTAYKIADGACYDYSDLPGKVTLRKNSMIAECGPAYILCEK